MKAIQALKERQGVSKLELLQSRVSNRAMTEVHLFHTSCWKKTKSKPVPEKSYKLDECIKFPHTGVDFFSKWLLSQV